MKRYDPRYVAIDEEVHRVIVIAYEMHGSYHALGRTLNFTCGKAAKKLVTGEAKHINKEKYEMLKFLVEQSL